MPVGNIIFSFKFPDLDIRSILIVPWDFCMNMESFRRWYDTNRTLTSTSLPGIIWRDKSNWHTYKNFSNLSKIASIPIALKSTLLKIKVNWHIRFHENRLISMETFHCTKGFLKGSGSVCFRLLNVFTPIKEIWRTVQQCLSKSTFITWKHSLN